MVDDVGGRRILCSSFVGRQDGAQVLSGPDLLNDISGGLGFTSCTEPFRRLNDPTSLLDF